MIIRISKSELDKIHQHAAQGYPHEVVGILGGARSENRVTLVHPLFNEKAETRNRYKVSGMLLFKEEQKLEEKGIDILGYYHSHPDHPALYSEYDQKHALPNMSYMIASVQKGKVEETLSWRLRDDRSMMDQESILMED